MGVGLGEGVGIEVGVGVKVGVGIGGICKVLINSRIRVKNVLIIPGNGRLSK